MDIYIVFNNDRQISLKMKRESCSLRMIPAFLRLMRLAKVIGTEGDERLVRLMVSGGIAGLDYVFFITPSDCAHCKVRIYSSKEKGNMNIGTCENHVAAHFLYASEKPLNQFESIITTELQMDGCSEDMELCCNASGERDFWGTTIYNIEFYIPLDSIKKRHGTSDMESLILAYSFLHRGLEAFS